MPCDRMMKLCGIAADRGLAGKEAAGQCSSAGHDRAVRRIAGACGAFTFVPGRIVRGVAFAKRQHSKRLWGDQVAFLDGDANRAVRLFDEPNILPP